MRNFAISTLGLGALLFGAPAYASSGIVHDGAMAGTFYETFISQQPGVTWTFQTSGLSAGADTVIHVQDWADPNGAFIAGNDDDVGFASRVIVPASSVARTLVVLVRSYSSTTQGSATFTATPSVGSGFTSNINFGGTKYYVGTLPLGAHVTTAERQGGGTDTLMLVVGGTDSHAVAFDDDDGVGNMSWAHLPEQCVDCRVIVGSYFSNTPTSATTNLIWDEDADTSDPDADGLGSSLEAVLGSNSTNADSDLDGLNDGYEVLGKDVWPPVKLPAWGSDPIQKDLFAEVDWQACVGAADVCPAGIDGGQVTPDQIPPIKTDFAPGGVRVHFDIGQPNTDPNTWTDWGDWGGAQRQSSTFTPDNVCGGEFASPERAGLFHNGLSFSQYNGHVCTLPTPNFVTTNNWTVISHELGHGLGLEHGGRPGRIALNFKANYTSRMNYYWEHIAPGFSHGPLLTLNPTALSEQAGVGTTDPSVLNQLSQAFKVNLTTGSIDWNRDGAITASPGLVKGPISLDYSHYAQSVFPGSPVASLQDASAAWVNAGGTIGNQLVVFGRGDDNRLQYVRASASSVNNGCGSFSSLDEGTVNCAGLPASATSVNKTLSFGPGAAEYNSKLLVVWQPATGTLRSNIVTVGTTGLSFASDVVLPGSVTAASDVAVLSTSTGVVKAWARSGGKLKQWTYQNNAWSSPVDQLWGDGTAINPTYGIAATIGFQDRSNTGKVYAAIPTGTNGTVEFARQETNGRWTKMAVWQDVPQPTTTARPGLAYQRRAGQANSIGRFYLNLNQGEGMVMFMTEGNLIGGSNERLRWEIAAYQGANMRGGTFLLDDLTRDNNLRAIETLSDRTTVFMPMADGIVPAAVKDLDDYQYVSGALRASLLLEALPLP
ncbi:MAG TPA: hypothetical protein VHM70_17120 [Polyangiaceae bacterium]|jgi:hypothetical protein|nr:hypothetical protein [Polyangiaceae bacterium]